MKRQHLNLLHTLSIILIAISVILVILGETGLLQIQQFDLVHLLYLSAVLWFIVWQVRRNAMRQ
ncbi:MAG: hypothetical protein AAF587_15720 [Bacteroidota bacterium]